MTKAAYLTSNFRPTLLSKKVLQARLSLRETQREFSERFLVTPFTVHNWETGKTEHIQKIHRTMLDALLSRLKSEGRLLDESIFVTIYREQTERKNVLR